MKSGNSTLQGPHQVPQKFNMTTFPLKSLNETRSPSVVASVKSGAGIDTGGLCA